MAEALQLGIPVMLHKEAEINAFLDAKQRIEKLGASVPVQVGVFLYFLERALTPVNIELGLANQQRYRLPIVHCQAPIKGPHSLVYTKSDAQRFGRAGLLETTIDYCAALRESSSLDFPVAVDVHSGVYVFEDLTEDNPLPSFFSVKAFKERRSELLEIAQARFQELSSRARSKGLGFVLENEIAVAMCPSPYSGNVPKLHFMPFTTRSAMNFITVSDAGSQTFDTAHYGASRSLPGRLENGSPFQQTVFELFECSSWEKYRERLGNFEDYLGAAAFHISNTEGPGVYLEKFPDLEKVWGRDGTEDGTITKEEFRRVFANAQRKGKLCAVEVNYNVSNIPQNSYSEADSFLRAVLL